MIPQVENWIDDVWSKINALPGAAEPVAQQQARWREFRERETLEIVVFGAYDAGKSTLLKRLLVNWGTAVPTWLTISGRRETFDLNRAQSNRVGFVDTPGLGSGSDEHDELTIDAIRLADAYLWVLPHQLVTTGQERYVEVLFGEDGIADATVAVIARMDEAGVDPSTNEAGFVDLCQLKKNELRAFVKKALGSRQLHSIHCVAADPYQKVGSISQPDQDMYNIGRNWDGIADLSKTILNLRKHRDTLRAKAGVRFLRLMLNDIRNGLQTRIEILAENMEGFKNEIDRHKQYEERLGALQRQEQAKLRRRIEDVILSAGRSGGSVGSDLIRNLQKELTKVVDEWAEGSFAAYRKLAAEIELEAKERMASPSMEGFLRLAEVAEEREPSAKVSNIDPVTLGKKALTFGPALKKSFETYATNELGMPLKDAADRLQKLESSGESVQAFLKSQGGSAAFRGAEHVEKASKFVKWANVIEAVGPLLKDLGDVALDVAEETMSAKRADERAQQRAELRQQLKAEAEKLRGEVASEFESACNGVREWIAERSSTFRESLHSMSEQRVRLNEELRSLNELFQNSPKNVR